MPPLLTAEDMLSLYARRALSPVEVLQAVTERVARLNPGLNAFAVMNPRALEAAGESEMRWRVGRPLGLLDGVPCTVKDLVDLAGFPTRRGSRITDPAPVTDDAPSVVGLKAAGAVIIGKTTTTEFGWKSPGDCPLHGITRNPWNPSYTTGGSSSGAGAAGAAGFGPLHIGTDAGGSIRIPAAWCGLVGLKPTYGRVPQWPASAFAWRVLRRPDDPHGARRRADAVRDGALRPARSVLPAGRWARLARRDRGGRRRAERRRAAPPRLRRAGRRGWHRRGGACGGAAGRGRRRGGGSQPELPDTRMLFSPRLGRGAGATGGNDAGGSPRAARSRHPRGGARRWAA